jgi:hypothetical protein
MQIERNLPLLESKLLSQAPRILTSCVFITTPNFQYSLLWELKILSLYFWTEPFLFNNNFLNSSFYAHILITI